MRFRLWFAAVSAVGTLLTVSSPATLRVSAHFAAGASGPGTAADGGAARATALLTTVAATLAWAAAAWLVLLVLLDLLSVLPGSTGRIAHRWRARLTPRLLAQVLRCSVATGTGFGVIGGVGAVAPAFASISATAPACAALPAAGLPDLDRPAPQCPAVAPRLAAPVKPGPSPAVRASTPAPAAGPAATSAAPTHHTVVPGDTLWAIADHELTARLGHPAAPSAIAARWPIWWQANRTVLGENPSRIMPGEVLTVPDH